MQKSNSKKAPKTSSSSLDRKMLLEKANHAYALLKQNPEAWKEAQEELTFWDVTLSDGLRDE